jgi:uncharacterized protein (TIGR02444 family)
MVERFRDNPFWDYSIAIYGKPRVADACLFLQDRYGLDVNLLLFCLWLGASGRGYLDEREIDACRMRTGDWRSRVVEPLRDIRRACHDEPLGVPQFLLQVFDPLIRQIELDAEHVAQLVLAEFSDNKPAEDVADDVKAFDAQRSISAYLAVADVRRDERLHECVRTIVAAAFPGANATGFDFA